MRRTLTILSSLFLATAVQAAPLVNVSSVVCSGEQTITLDSAMSLTCSGDYSFSDGSIGFEGMIRIKAAGNLRFNNIAVDAKILLLESINGLVSGQGNTFTWSTGIAPLHIPGTANHAGFLNFTNPPPTVYEGPVTDAGFIPGVPDYPFAPPNKPDSPGGKISIISLTGLQGENYVSSKSALQLASTVISSQRLTITSSVPEPSTYAMLFAGLLMLAGATKRRKAKR